MQSPEAVTLDSLAYLAQALVEPRCLWCSSHRWVKLVVTSSRGVIFKDESGTSDGCRCPSATRLCRDSSSVVIISSEHLNFCLIVDAIADASIAL